MTKHGVKKIEELIHLGKADVHIHSCHSDGKPTILEILEFAENKTDLDIIAIADHNTMDGAFEAEELMNPSTRLRAGQKPYRFELILGEEVSSKEGHILGLFLTRPIRAGLSAHDTIKEIRRQGGLAIAAHPFEHMRYRVPGGLSMDGVGLMTLLRERGHFHGIEIVNATPTLGKENLRASFINKTVLLRAETGSSDAHIAEAIGKGYTLFEGRTTADFRHALAHHQTQAMYDRWTVMALAKYAYFFIPRGLRIFFYTLFIAGKKEKKVDLVNVPKDFARNFWADMKEKIQVLSKPKKKDKR